MVAKSRDSNSRLGDNAAPISYKIKFVTDFETFKFLGDEEIQISIKKGTKSIKLNSNNLKLLGATVTSKGKSQECKITYDEKGKAVSLAVKTPVSGACALSIKFSGINNDDMYGFYRSEYKGKDGKTKYLLTTQFEPADARAAFPCFDEPAFKAKFDITLVVPKEMQAISNMPIKSVKAMGRNKEVEFYTTPKMSSYLLYLGVGQFDKVSSASGRLKFNVYATPGKAPLCRMALSYAKKFVAFYEKYFGINYPLPKVDLIAIPDFAAGAMENWGAITFREVAILGSEKGSAISAKQQIAITIAHELAHQWFGDLVTMEWWNDLWLNESFATFMSYRSVNAVFPKWKMDKQYFDEVIATAFSADALKTTHPISVDVHTPEEINEIFDEISYEKGGTVLHMLEDYSTPKVFREGLHNYLRQHSYSNATKYDLWGAIRDAAKKSSPQRASQIKAFADKWLDYTGYPIVISQRIGSTLKLRQVRFVVSNISGSNPSKPWPIMLKYTEGGSDPEAVFMDKSEMDLKLRTSGMVKLNYGQDYLYRVKYDSDTLQGIGSAIKAGKINGVDAWGVEDDLFTLARGGAIKANEYMKFIGDYCMDADYPANIGINWHLFWLESKLYDTDMLGGIKQLELEFGRRTIERLGWAKRANEENTDTMLRGLAIEALGRLGDGKAISFAKEKMEQRISGNEIDPNIRSAVYYTYAWNGGSAEFRALSGLYLKESNPEEKRRLLQAFGSFTSESVIKEALAFSMSKGVRLQDSFVIPTVLSSNPKALEYIPAWTYSQWKTLMERYDIGTHMLQRFVDNFSSCYKISDYNKLKAFFSKKQNLRGDVKKSLAQALEKIETNIKFRKANSLDA